MPTILEEIPPSMLPAANAALNWINNQKGTNYKLTGLVDPDLNWQIDEGPPTDLGLVLCDDDICAREQVRIQKLDNGYQITAVEAADSLIPAHLDPPAGVRRTWLDDQLCKADFTVLVFYRGFW